MIVKFWRWLCEEPLDPDAPTYLETAQREYIDFLEAELKRAYRRVFKLSEGSGKSSSRQSTSFQSDNVSHEPIQLKSRKGIDERRRELERLSQKRFEDEGPLPEVKEKLEYWTRKTIEVEKQEQETFDELAALEDKLDGQEEIAN